MRQISLGVSVGTQAVAAASPHGDVMASFMTKCPVRPLWLTQGPSESGDVP
jgi:hypothetical protein